MANLAEINAWLEGVTPDERVRLNHPTTILTAWKASKRSLQPAPKQHIVKTEFAVALAGATKEERRAAFADFDADHVLEAIAPDVSVELRQRLLGQIERGEDARGDKIVSLVREAKGLLAHPNEQNITAIHKKLAAIVTLVDASASARPASAAPTRIALERGALRKALGLERQPDLEIPDFLKRTTVAGAAASIN
jgi:hypothetical protein